MKIEKPLTDEVILVELGKRIAQLRLEFQLTQAALAEQAGISKRTLERIEAGNTVQMSTMVRIFRTLDVLDRLDGLIPEVSSRPMNILKLKGKERQRAPRKKKQSTDESWQWGDEA